MPYASDRDRDPHPLELTDPAFPVAPLNIFLETGYAPGTFDLCWTDPSILASNSRFSLYGVNIYRSFDSEFGPYHRITTLPVGATFWRDQTDNVVVVEEIVDDSQWVLRGDCTADDPHRVRFVFRTVKCPIVIPASQAVPEHNRLAVQVTIDGVPAHVKRVLGDTGEVELETLQFPNVATQKLDASPIPGDNSVVKVTYRYNRSLLRTDLGTRVFYRVTTVGIPITSDVNVVQAQNLVETPLERAAVTNSREIEKLDWIWREAIRRNRWIIQQGGERVKVFLQKTVGEPCPCIPDGYHHQPLNDCHICLGTGVLGGYEGPYDITIAPDDGERRLNQLARGRQQEHVYEVWTGPTPLLNQRDFIVKLNGERYSIGGVRMPSNRGMLLQQHFNIGYIDEKDIRYRVPVDRLRSRDELDLLTPPLLAPAVITGKPNIPDERELRGRTKTWENITF